MSTAGDIAKLAEIQHAAAERREREAQILADYAGAEVEWRVAWDSPDGTASFFPAEDEAGARRILEEFPKIQSQRGGRVEYRRVLPWRPA